MTFAKEIASPLYFSFLSSCYPSHGWPALRVSATDPKLVSNEIHMQCHSPERRRGLTSPPASENVCGSSKDSYQFSRLLNLKSLKSTSPLLFKVTVERLWQQMAPLGLRKELQQSWEWCLAEGKTGDFHSPEGTEQAHRHMGEVVGEMGLERGKALEPAYRRALQGDFIEKSGTWLGC